MHNVSQLDRHEMYTIMVPFQISLLLSTVFPPCFPCIIFLLSFCISCFSLLLLLLYFFCILLLPFFLNPLDNASAFLLLFPERCCISKLYCCKSIIHLALLPTGFIVFCNAFKAL